MTAGDAPPQLRAKARRAARRFAEVVCPPEMAAHHRTDRVLAELELMMSALSPAARRVLTVTLVVLDEAARLNPRSRGRRFTRLDDEAAEAYVRGVLARHSVPAELVRRLKGLVVMCYYELPPVQREIGYDPAPYIAAVSRRRLESYGPEIRAGEVAVTARAEASETDQIRSDQSNQAEGERGEGPGQRGEGPGEHGEEAGERGEGPGERGEEAGERGEEAGERGERAGERGQEAGEQGERGEGAGEQGERGEGAGEQGERGVAS